MEASGAGHLPSPATGELTPRASHCTCRSGLGSTRGGRSMVILWRSQSSTGDSPPLGLTPTHMLTTSPSQPPGFWERPRNPHPTAKAVPRRRGHETKREKERERQRDERWEWAGGRAGTQERKKQRHRDAERKRESWRGRNINEQSQGTEQKV